MSKRALKVLTVIGIGTAVGAFTWMLSWLIQYIYSLVSTGPAFHLTGHAVNRLAVSTVLAAYVIAVFILIFQAIMDGCLLVLIWLFFGSAILAGLGWLAASVFPGTPVSTPAGQIIYGILVLFWGFALYYIFLGDLEFDED